MSLWRPRPGMPPSPNERQVLSACERAGLLVAPFTVLDAYTACREQGVGGHAYKPSDGSALWMPWSVTTVRNHLDRLSIKGHLQRGRVGRRNVYYRKRDEP